MRKYFTFIILTFLSFNINSQSIYFPPLTGNTWDTISPQSLNWCQYKIDSLFNYLDSNNTKAFILLKNGKIVIEKYFGTQTQSSPWQWASAGKTITSFLVGIAQQQGHLSISDTTSHYLGQAWTNCTQSQEEKITIRHQLTMTSGLDDGVTDNSCTVDTCLIYKADAGTRWAYHNAPYTLLGSVLSNATNITLNAYATQELKNHTGMTGSFFSVGNDEVFFSNARSMARFGLLILNKGKWDNNPLMTDTNYFNQMTNTSQQLNNSYGYLWWLNGKTSYMVPSSQIVFPGFLSPNAPADMIAAMGKDGQFCNVVPSQNLVWIRMGNAPNSLPVPFLMNDKIWEYINDLDCSSTGLNEENTKQNLFTMFPNPCNEILNIKSGKQILKIEILNAQGQVLKTESIQKNEVSISIKELMSGLYFVNTTMIDCRVRVGKLIKE